MGNNKYASPTHNHHELLLIYVIAIMLNNISAKITALILPIAMI